MDMVLGSGPVVSVVLWLLVAFSVGSWGIILYKLFQISVARRESERFIDVDWDPTATTDSEGEQPRKAPASPASGRRRAGPRLPR